MENKNQNFESMVLKIAEDITTSAEQKPERDSRVSLAFSSENKTIVENSKRVNNYTIDKAKNVLSIVLTPEIKTEFLAKLYGRTADEIESVAFKHRKNLAVNMAIAKITKMHLADTKPLVAFLKVE